MRSCTLLVMLKEMDFLRAISLKALGDLHHKIGDIVFGGDQLHFIFLDLPEVH